MKIVKKGAFPKAPFSLKQESRKAGKQESRKAGKQESRKAGKQESRKAGKQESRKAGKQESRKAGKQERIYKKAAALSAAFFVGGNIYLTGFPIG
ncbi:hypothetical protein [Teredinibacter turnerae]|uniref:hypothetical protein n=1 Tax=Teredinibacter turnerae TaxID=2426 RepID=UPI00059EE975|nr:hypothetical protein [Teredinibacter turnerae]